jgi:hypothetical protein
VSATGYAVVALLIFLSSCCLHTDIFCEAMPLPLFQNWNPKNPYTADPSMAIPESPLFCPRDEFFTIAKDPNCSEFTYDLLCDMRDLTDLFIAHNRSLNTVLEVETDDDIDHVGPSILDYDVQVAEIRARLASLPSAYTPGLPVTNDWIYESCRIASIIYASAIIMRVPFSVAAEPGRSVILADAASLPNAVAGSPLMATRLTEALYEVIEKSNVGNVWGDMAGVLYWVTTVGAAAARTPTSINMSQTPHTRSEAYATWVRRCLIMFGTRTMILLIFQHPAAVIMAQKKLLKVQQLIGNGTARRLS